MPAVGNLHTPIFINILGVSPGLLANFAFVERIWDAVTDGLMGWITDNTKSRWGKRKPYILVGGILTALFIPVIYMLNPAWSTHTIAAWLLVCMLLLALFSTIWNIPLQCLILESTPNTVERTNVAVWRGYAGKVGWLGIHWILYFVTLPIFAVPGDKTRSMLNGAVWVLSIMAAIGLVCALLPLIVKNRVGTGVHDVATRKKSELSLWQNMKLTFQNRSFVILLMFTLLFTLGFNLKASLDFQTQLMYVFKGDLAKIGLIKGWGSTISLVFGIVGIPIFQYLARTRSKGYALAWVMAVVLLAGFSTIVCYQPNYPWLCIIPGILMAPANTALWILIPSMNGDVVDYDETVCGERREGSYAATYSWFFKVAQSLANYGSLQMLVIVGFDAKLGADQPEVINLMRIMVVLLPAVFILVAIWLISKYPLTPKRIAEVRAELDSRKKAASDQSGA